MSKGVQDTHKAKTFSNGATNLTTFGDVTNKTEEVLKSSKAFKDVKGVGKSVR